MRRKVVVSIIDLQLALAFVKCQGIILSFCIGLSDRSRHTSSTVDLYS